MPITLDVLSDTLEPIMVQRWAAWWLTRLRGVPMKHIQTCDALLVVLLQCLPAVPLVPLNPHYYIVAYMHGTIIACLSVGCCCVGVLHMDWCCAGVLNCHHVAPGACCITNNSPQQTVSQ
jgi:hypothetical protein